MSDKLKYRESKRIAAMINRVRDATDDDKPIKSRDRLSELELENAALKKENAALKKYLPAPEELPEPAETYMMTQYLVDGKAHKPAHCLVVAKIYYDVLREDSVLQITALKAEIAALKAENAALKAEAVIAEKYGLSQAAEICRDAAVSFPINGYERGYNDACRDNYNAILKVKDKP